MVYDLNTPQIEKVSYNGPGIRIIKTDNEVT